MVGNLDRVCGRFGGLGDERAHFGGRLEKPLRGRELPLDESGEGAAVPNRGQHILQPLPLADVVMHAVRREEREAGGLLREPMGLMQRLSVVRPVMQLSDQPQPLAECVPEPADVMASADNFSTDARRVRDDASAIELLTCSATSASVRWHSPFGTFLRPRVMGRQRFA